MRFIALLVCTLVVGGCVLSSAATTAKPAFSHKSFKTLTEALQSETQYSGYIEVNPEIGGNLFYWFFESRNEPSTDPLILWMTGGPGCSGELAVINENGPFKLTPDLQVVTNPWSWNNKANVLYIDQPYGTGFSYVNSPSDYIHDETQMAADMYTFLQMWFTKFNQFQSNPFFIIGESFGGHYVPALSAKVIQENEHLGSGALRLNYKGSAVGNGMVDPYWQFPQYGPFSFDNGLITEAQYTILNQTATVCQELIADSSYYPAFQICLPIIELVLGWSGINPYNVRLQCPPQFPGLCYNLTAATDYLNEPSVQAMLGVDRPWEVCNYNVNGQFTTDWVTSYAGNVTTILEAGYPFMAYSGTLDFICNWYGGREWTTQLEWAHKDAWDNGEFADWHFSNGTVIGTFKQIDSLTMVGVYNAGHMVPMDQPEYAYYLLELFLNSVALS